MYKFFKILINHKTLKDEVEMMRTTIEEFLSLNSRLLSDSGPAQVECDWPQQTEKDGLAFHGVFKDTMETSSKTLDMRRNFLDHNVRRILKKEWNLDFRAKFRNIAR